MRLKALLCLALLVTFGTASAEPAPLGGGETKALFLGNSYTGVNNLPALVEGLAVAGGHVLTTDRNTPGGNTLGAPQSNGSPHKSNSVSLAKIASTSWDFVVLQEQSYLPTIPYTRNQYMDTGAQSLALSIANSDPTTRVLLYQTWGRRDASQFCYGSHCVTFADFDEMQDALTTAYDGCASLIGADVAPVGEAWRMARALQPGIVLHSNDGSHPNLSGSYLAACVFYAKLFDESPVGLTYDAGLAPSTAQFLQEVAQYTAFCGIELYCDALPNSAGPGATLNYSGSPSLSDNSLTLEVSGLPPTGSGLFFFGSNQVSLPFGDGVRCVGGVLRRMVPMQSDGAGTVQKTLDFQSPPFASGPLQAAVGRTLNFQYWYRDAAGPGGSGYNVSSALAATLCL